MKYVRYNAEFVDVYGNIVEIPDPDRAKQRSEREKVIAAGMEQGLKPSEMTWTPLVVEADFAAIITWFANSVGTWNVDEGDKSIPGTPEEIGYALHVIRAFQNPTENLVAVEENSLEWLIRQLRSHGSKAFTGVTSALILERLADQVEPEPPKSS